MGGDSFWDLRPVPLAKVWNELITLKLVTSIERVADSYLAPDDTTRPVVPAISHASGLAPIVTPSRFCRILRRGFGSSRQGCEIRSSSNRR
jgi:hypothetical protein